MAKGLALGKVPKMLVMLGSFQPSGTNSAFAKIKDPTGSMGAALHSSVLQQQAELGPGCVLLLQQVSVFTPAPGTIYAAVTARNIVRVSKWDTIVFAALAFAICSIQLLVFGIGK
ncbi:hypothetical protein OEZ86_000808 [Tetradesmus obliquus]|nr:hypothetical protein OEZ86_000808 [Tetradesmus obliquus]